jgi:ADP-heptose:LPS heptosyltransferase
MPEPSPVTNSRSLPERLKLGLLQRVTDAGLWIDRRLSRLPDRAYIDLRWPGQKPWQLPSLEIASYAGGLGDELMITPALRGVKKRNPGCHIRFHSRYPELFRLYDFIDEVVPLARGTLPARHVRLLRYSHLAPPVRTLTHHLAEQLGIDVRRAEPAAPVLPADFSSPLANLPRPIIAIQPGGSGWTPNKQWGVQRWTSLVRALLPHATVVELGTESLFGSETFDGRFLGLAGKTSTLGFAAAVRDADLFIGQASAGMHLAGAFGTPLIVIFGGYEHPAGIGYSAMVSFYTQVQCAPCWLTTPCPHQMACMTAIEVDEIRAAAVAALQRPRPKHDQE